MLFFYSNIGYSVKLEKKKIVSVIEELKNREQLFSVGRNLN